MQIDKELLDALAQEPYEPRGILNSEMALVIQTCRNLHVDLVLESGRARGQSTYLLGKYLPDTTIYSVDRATANEDDIFALERVNHLHNVFCFWGHATDVIPRLLDDEGARRVAVLLDGPKGSAALDLVATGFKRPQVLVGFIHDMRALDHGLPSEHRLEAEKRFPGAFYSDDPVYVEATKHLDLNVAESTGWKPYHVRRHDKPERPFEPTGSYGPTVGVFFNNLAGQAEVAA